MMNESIIAITSQVVIVNVIDHSISEAGQLHALILFAGESRLVNMKVAGVLSNSSDNGTHGNANAPLVIFLGEQEAHMVAMTNATL